MNDADAAAIALRHYRTLWYGQEWGDTAAAWQTEYDAVSSGAFAPTLITASSFDGGSATALKNFEQSVRLSALQSFRAENDAEYAAAIFAEPALAAQKPSVMYPLFHAAFFPH